MRSLVLLLLAGCAGSPPDPDLVTGPATGPSLGSGSESTTTGPRTTPEPTSSWACRSDVPDDQLNGSYPPAELPAPTFTATNYDGTPRTKDDLQGHVTVMWFYPAANTAG